MSDSLRKDFSTEAKETIQPDATKSNIDQAGEALTDLTDRAAAHIEPNSSKSTSQELHDEARETTDEQTEGGKSETVAEKAKNLVGLGDSESLDDDEEPSLLDKAKEAIGLGADDKKVEAHGSIGKSD